MYVHSNEGEECLLYVQKMRLVTDDLELDLKNVGLAIIIKNIRKAFLRNERLDVCVKCYELEEHGGRSDRIKFNNMYQCMQRELLVEAKH